MPPPGILTVTRRYVRKNKYIQFTGEYHLDLVLALGGVPVMLPAVRGALNLLDAYLPLMDGLLLVEGEDLHPDTYKAPRAARTWIEEVDETKDQIEFFLIRHALKEKIPYLGICRGCHILNVACGGTLYTDVQKERGTDLLHINHDNYDGHRHAVELLRGTPLHRWYRRSRLQVTSYHHQGVKKLAKRFVPLAYAEDGLLEAFYDPSMPFLYGIQFHPERMQEAYAGNRRVYQEFLRACKQYRKKRDALGTSP